jgi:ArsR family transcriptional regulator, arsenate/arsenite/antimonite-responsive transcriptional repressor / arsenate reductase (thioredoxin)
LVEKMYNLISLSPPPPILTLLAHRIRWQILSALVHSDQRASELVELLNQPQNLISYHLQKLRQSGLVRIQHSRADGREIYYSLDLDRARQLYLSAGETLHPGISEKAMQTSGFDSEILKARVLFLCTHNSARSQMAEGILRARSGGSIEAFSAGTEPTSVHPLAIRALQELNINISDQQSKNLQDFQGQKFDYIITVCDRAREVCPIFPEDPVQIHWSFPDPTEVEGTESQRLSSFREIALQLNTRIAYLLLIMQRKVEEKNLEAQ